MKNKLNGRNLWYDGTVEITPEKVTDAILSGADVSTISVSEMTDEIKSYNQLTGSNISVKDELDFSKFDFSWNIPQKYKELSIDTYVSEVLSEKIPHDETRNERIERLLLEIQWFKDNNLIELLQTLIYIIDTFKKKKVVWGVGRGSSCASYLLYLIGIHSVDPIKYHIPIEEFLR